MTSTNGPVGEAAPPLPSRQPGADPSGFVPPVAQPGLNTMAILALVFAFVVAPLGIVFGIIGRKQTARTGERGKGLATAGLILGIVFTLVGIALIVVAANSTATPSVSKASVESQIADQFQASAGSRPDSVSCAGDLTAKVGATDVCSVVVGGKSTSVTATVTTVVGNTANFDVK